MSTARALAFSCGPDTLAGIIHSAPGSTGVLVVSGGAQTRVGAHRIFVELASHLAETGIPVLRFDRRGIGDSDGEDPGFEASGPDIEAATLAFRQAAPSVQRIVGLGLCDGAAALALHGGHLDGLILLNPWILETGAPLPAAALKAHYRGRFAQAQSWKRLLRGEIDVLGALRSLARSASPEDTPALGRRVAAGLKPGDRPVSILLSGRDATAQAFAPLAATLGTRARILHIRDADHSFTADVHRQALFTQVAAQIRQVTG